MSRRLENKVVVVTGGSAGVGRAAVRRFASENAKLAILARGQEGLKATEKELVEQGYRALAISVDVSDYHALEQAANEIEEKLGPIDVWVNNAMVSVFAPFSQITPEEFKRVTEVTYLGYVYGTKVALERMLKRNSGVIVQVGSALAYRGIPLQSAYSGAKHAIEGFTESVRSELIHERTAIHLTMVHVPAVNTPQFDWTRSRLPNEAQPVPPIYQPEVVADAIVWAALHRRRSVTVGASAMMTIVLNKLFPALGDLYLAYTGYGSQQTDQVRKIDQDDNLFKAVDTSPGARGRFDKQASTSRVAFLVSANKGKLLSTISLVVAGLGLGLAMARPWKAD